MAARNQFSEFEELSWLRRRVTELERHATEKSRAWAVASEGRDVLENLLNYAPGLVWVDDEFGRRVTENAAFRGFCEHNDASVVAALRSAADGTLTARLEGREFRIARFNFRTASGRYYTGTSAVAQEAGGVATHQHFRSDFLGILECRGNRIVDASDSILGWLGHQRDALADPGLDWRELTPSHHRTRDDKALAELLASGSMGAYQKEFTSREGKVIPVMVSAQGSPDSFILLALNLSERRELESRLLRAQKLESLGLIGGGVAHDFNNLLATIMGNASMSLEALSRDHPAYRPLSEVLVATRRATDLTQQMLAYCGRAQVQVEPMDLSALVREIGSLLETTISKKISLRFDLAIGLPCIDADAGQIQQVVMNLVINASDAIGENPGEIVVTTGVVDSADMGRCVCFEVRDTGCGMSEEIQAQVFNPFFTTKAEGRGLGLSAVQGIVRNHRGVLKVESEPGRGTMFQVLFPASASRLKVRSRAPEPRAEVRGSETVLVADDDESIRRMTRAALERFGYRVLLAANGEEAVDVFRKNKDDIAVVLLDWAMPVMNGDEALRSILAEDPSARVVLTSGYAETETLSRGDGSAMADFIQKPYTTTQLAEKLREAIRRKT
jgi:signal transduction histidine kinase/ActR/RegA family two-component response regulator